MRRLIGPEPYAASATWTRRMALAGALLALSAVLLAHRPMVAKPAAIAVLGCGLLCALLALMAALRAIRVIWRTGRRGIGRTLAGMLLAVATLAYPAYLAALAFGTPLAAAASTDPADPPHFSQSAKAVALRGGLDASDQAFAPPSPELQPITLDLDGAEAFSAVQKAAASLRWRVIETAAPGKLGPGHLDAVTASPVMRLPLDIAIRVRPVAGQTRIDMRVAARLGLYDFGASAALIRQFAAALEQIDDQ